MKISNIIITEESDPITLYTASIIIDDIICIKDIKINLYEDEFIVEYPQVSQPINNDIKESIDIEILSHITNKEPLHELLCNWLKSGFDY